jgi:hypothetical protein
MKSYDGSMERAGQVISCLVLITIAVSGTFGVWSWIRSACVTELVQFNC